MSTTTIFPPVIVKSYTPRGRQSGPTRLRRPVDECHLRGPGTSGERVRDGASTTDLTRRGGLRGREVGAQHAVRGVGGGTLIATVTDPDGNAIGLVQSP